MVNSSSVGWEPGKEADIFALLQNSGPEIELCSTLPPGETDFGEELLRLLSVVYPEETEDAWTMEPHQGRAAGSSPGERHMSPVILLRDESSVFWSDLC